MGATSAAGLTNFSAVDVSSLLHVTTLGELRGNDQFSFDGGVELRRRSNIRGYGVFLDCRCNEGV